MASDRIDIERKTKSSKKRGRGRSPKKTPMLNIRPMISELDLISTDGENLEISFATRIDMDKLAKPREIVALLGLEPSSTRVLLRNTLLVTDQVELRENLIAE